MGVIKHEPGEPRKPRKKPPTLAQSPAPHDYRPYLDLSELAEPLEGIVRILGSYVHNATLGENGLNLFTGRNSYPVRLVLEGEAVDRIADALSRMADALQGRTNATV